jgi:hypothetical protein
MDEVATDTSREYGVGKEACADVLLAQPVEKPLNGVQIARTRRTQAQRRTVSEPDVPLRLRRIGDGRERQSPTSVIGL